MNISIPKAAVTFLCLLLGVVVILALVNWFFGKRLSPCLQKICQKLCCCCSCKVEEDDDDEFDSDVEYSNWNNDGRCSSSNSSTKEAIEMEEQKKRQGSLSDDVRIHIPDNTPLVGGGVGADKAGGPDTKKNKKMNRYSTISNSSKSYYMMDSKHQDAGSSNGGSIGDVNAVIEDDTQPILGGNDAVPKRSQSFKMRNKLFRQLSISSRPGSLYGSFRSQRASLDKSYSIDSASVDGEPPHHGEPTIVNFQGIESISIQILIVFDKDSKTLSSGVKQFEVFHKNIDNSNSYNNNSSSSTTTRQYYWQVVVEIVDQTISDPTIKNRIKTKYKSGDKIHFQRNLETDNMDCEHLDNYLVRYSIYARRGTRVSHKQLFGKTNVFLATLKQQNVLFEWRVIPVNESNYH